MGSLPLSMLQGLLHPKQINFDENYLIELPNKELVTLGDLTTFWIEGHQKIKKALDIIKESKEKCNTTGENTSTQSQTTGKKSRKSTKKTTTSQK